MESRFQSLVVIPSICGQFSTFLHLRFPFDLAFRLDTPSGFLGFFDSACASGRSGLKTKLSPEYGLLLAVLRLLLFVYKILTWSFYRRVKSRRFSFNNILPFASALLHLLQIFATFLDMAGPKSVSNNGRNQSHRKFYSAIGFTKSYNFVLCKFPQTDASLSSFMLCRANLLDRIARLPSCSSTIYELQWHLLRQTPNQPTQRCAGRMLFIFLPSCLQNRHHHASMHYHTRRIPRSLPVCAYRQT